MRGAGSSNSGSGGSTVSILKIAAVCLLLGLLLNMLRFAGNSTTSPVAVAPPIPPATPCPPQQTIIVEKRVEVTSHPEDPVVTFPKDDGPERVSAEARQKLDEENGVAADGGGEMQGDGVSPLGPDEQLAKVFRGVRTFENSCLYPDTDRVAILAEGAVREKVQKRTKVATGDIQAHYIEGDTFVLRDVCALGHFPKDLAHFHSWVEAELSEKKLKKSSPTGSPAREGDQVIHQVLLGHRCVSKDPKKTTNKRTPVFRDVLRHWVDAITEHPVMDDAATPASSALAQDQDKKRYFYFYEDVVDLIENGKDGSGKGPTILCFKNRLLEREEKWRWFPSLTYGHSFRRKLWKHFNLQKDYEALRGELLHTHFDKQRKLQVTILRRDEDRHFQEANVAKFLEEKFGAVANILYTQWDRPPPKHRNPKNDIPVPAFAEQARALFDTDVLIAAHGAALSSVVFMRPGSVVIELFPHNFRYYMYEELVNVMSLRYTAFEGSTVSPPKCCRGRGSLLLASRGGDNNTSDADKDTGDGETAGEKLDAMQSLKTAGELAAAKVPIGSFGIKSLRELNGLRECKKCDIAASNSEWYYMVKNSLATVWLRNSRLSNVHHFDIRR